jgi:conjugative relaxase-like TrwC/TraI family protein
VLTLAKVDAGRVDYYEGRAPDPEAPPTDDSAARHESAGSDGYEGDVAGRHDSDRATGQVVDERAGRWVGDLATRLGLRGEVVRGELSELLEQRHPHTGESLGRRVSDRRREGPDGREQTLSARAGFDAQWAPPKSVSVVWAVGDERFSGEVEAAVDSAVGAGLRYLQDHATFTRVGAGGAARIRAAGLIGATYRHDTSRAADPQYHVHVVIPNLTYADGRWLRLDGHALYVHRLAADRVFQAQLRAELTERLGVGWTPGRTEGTYEVAGVSRAVIDEMSQRRAQILERVGADASPAAREAAALDSRRAKGEPREIDDLRAEWRARAAEHGLGRAELEGLVDRVARAPVSPVVDEAIAAQLEGADGLTRHQSVFDRRHVVGALSAAQPAGVRYRELMKQADEFVRRDGLELVEPAAQEGRRALAVGDRFSTRELLEIERRLLADAEVGRSRGVARVDEGEVEAVLQARPELEGEQAALIRRLTRSGDQVEVVRARPGTGKTYAIDAAREVWQRAGVPVYGVALSARAAGELEAAAGIPSTTIARLKVDVGNGERLAHGSVLVVDEAGMVGTRDFAWLHERVQEADGKLVPVGDTRQLPEIEAGGMLGALADRLGACTLDRIRRQEQDWDRWAVRALHSGDHGGWLAAQVEHERVSVSVSASAAHQAIVAGWWQDAQTHGLDGTAMLADRRDTVRALNALARTRMGEEGRLHGPELDVAGRRYAAGDRVVTLRNHRGLGVRNGDRGTVTEVLPHGGLTVDLDERDDPVHLGAGNLADGHVDHGYASTVHKLQGATLQTTTTSAPSTPSRSPPSSPCRAIGSTRACMSSTRACRQPPSRTSSSGPTGCATWNEVSAAAAPRSRPAASATAR